MDDVIVIGTGTAVATVAGRCRNAGRTVSIIDGLQHVVSYSSISFELPADRARKLSRPTSFLCHLCATEPMEQDGKTWEMAEICGYLKPHFRQKKGPPRRA